ncbi:MAG: hypothetical protein HY823_07045 [Acidobacteria bacterium]|nr:hypothetical protein [Acidobacteriota bacterium]
MRLYALFLLAVLRLGAQSVEDCFARDPGPLDFIRGEGFEQAILQAMTGDALVGLDSSGKPVPRLALDWRMEGGWCRFRLRPARFQDGSLLRPADLAWTYGEIQRRADASPTKRAALEGLEVRVASDGAVSIRSSRPLERLLRDLALVPIVKEGNPELATGPYHLAREEGAWVFRAREHFLRPRIARFRFRLVPEAESVLQQLQKGWLSLGVPPARSGLVPPPTHRELRQPMHAQLVMWSRQPRTLAWLERWRGEAFPAHLLGAQASPSRGLWPESLGFPAMHLTFSPPLSGQSLELLHVAGDPFVEKLLLALRERARVDGVDLRLRPAEAGIHHARLQRGDFQWACAIVVFEPHPWAVLEYLVPGGPMNFTGWSDPASASLVPRLRRPGDPAWADLQRLWSRSAAALPLLDFHSVTWVDRRLKVEPCPFGMYLATPGAAGWTWIE